MIYSFSGKCQAIFAIALLSRRDSEIWNFAPVMVVFEMNFLKFEYIVRIQCILYILKLGQSMWNVQG